MTTSTQLARNGTNGGGHLAASLAPADWTREYLDTIKAVYGKGCTDAEFALAVQASKTTGLRIDTRELWVYKRGANDPMTLTISVDGFRAIAHASGVYAGEEGPLYCAKDGVWHEVWTGEGTPHAAKFTVYRRDFERPFAAVVLFAEFKALGGMLWAKAPVHMLGVRAGTHAFRKAFRQEIAARELQVGGLGVQLGSPDDAGGPDVAGDAGALEADSRVVDGETGEIVDAAPAETGGDDAARREREAAVDAYGAAWDAANAAGVAGRYPRQVPATVALDEIRKGTATLRRRAAADGAPAAER